MKTLRFDSDIDAELCLLPGLGMLMVSVGFVFNLLFLLCQEIWGLKGFVNVPVTSGVVASGKSLLAKPSCCMVVAANPTCVFWCPTIALS